MKRKILFIIILFSIVSTVRGQSYLVKNDGSKIEFKKLKLNEGFVKLTIPKSKEKLEIKLEEVKSYYSLYDNSIYYLKPSFDLSNNVGFEFIQRIEEGKIKIYKKVVITKLNNFFEPQFESYSGPQFESNSYLYLEKDNDYFNVLDTKEPEHNNEKLEKLKTLVSDDSVTVRLLNTLSYKYKRRHN